MEKITHLIELNNAIEVQKIAREKDKKIVSVVYTNKKYYVRYKNS